MDGYEFKAGWFEKQKDYEIEQALKKLEEEHGKEVQGDRDAAASQV